SGWRGATLTPLASYPWTQRWEKNLDYYKSFSSAADTSIDGYHWTSTTTYYDRPESTFPFEVNDLDTSRAVRLSPSWVGRAETGHYLWAGVVSRTGLPAAQRVRTTVVDSVYWFGKQPFTATGNAPGSILSEGPTNALVVWGKTSPGAPTPTNNSTAAGTNWFELTYWRAFAALEGVLPFNSGDAAGEFEVSASGFGDPSALRVYDVTDPLAPAKLTGTVVEPQAGRFRVRLQDSTATGARRAYWAFDTPKALAPERYETVTRRLLYAGASGDYLLVAPEAFLAAVQPLVDLRRAQGLDVLVAPLESLQDEFNGGRRSPYALRRFFRFALGKWDSRFALLVGDGSMDPQRFSLQSGVDLVPTQRIMGPLRASSGSDFFLETIVSDTWLVWALESPDPQLAPKLPDMHLGRLPVRNVTELQGVVEKLVAYESVGRDETWRRRMTLSSDDLYSGVNLFGGGGGGAAGYCLRSYEGVFRQINETVRGIILDEAGLRQSEPEIFDLKDWLVNQPQDTVGCSSPGVTCRCDAAAFESRARLIYLPQLLSRLNSGRLWWNYQGHANEYLLAHEAFYKSNGPSAARDYQSIVNVDRPFLFTAFACHPNAFGHFQENGGVRGGPSLGEMLVLRGGRQGAVASWGSSGFELLPSSGTAHINVSLARALFSKPPRDPVLGDAGARVVLGEAITKALLENYQIMRFSPFERDVAISYVLLGDPATRISVGRPQAFVTANGDTVESGVRVELTTPGDSLRVQADLASNVRLDTLQVLFAGPTGPPAPLAPSRYTVIPAFPDTGAASSGGRRYGVVVRDTLLADSYRYILRTVDRWGLANSFDVLFELDTDLLASGVPVQDGDAVSPVAPLSLVVRSPRALDPASEIELRLDGAPVAFTADTAAGDPSGRSLRLDLQNPALAGGDHALQLTAAGGAMRAHTFRVTVTGPEMRLRDPLAFPNPMEDEGTWFSFYLESRTAADVLLRVFTVTGRLLYERRLDDVPPSYQQLHWDGRDHEGSEIANGTYVYRLIV
ncbi:MAG: C25 family cysteine peptidase, partial [Vicinamibacterales bacterium]|nr:C25 family cysteine peptidase [Vicinamibacterales bacterium]